VSDPVSERDRRPRRRRARLVFVAVAVAVVAASSVALGQSPISISDTPFGTPTPSNPTPGDDITAVRGDRQGNWLDQTQSEVLARNGMVASSQPLATQAGLDILRRGGNAADAAVATAAHLGVVEPYSAGIGGDMFVLYYSAKDRKLYGLNASGWAPRSWTPEYFSSRGITGDAPPLFGVHSVTVPGVVDGWDQLLDRFGSMSFKRVLEPAVQTAREGFGLTERIHSDWSLMVDDLSEDPDSTETFLRDGDAPPLYSNFRNPDLARAYELLQRDGPKAFYRGPIARAIVDKLNSLGGEWTLDDLRDYHAQWDQPIHSGYKGYDVYQMPPNSQGFATLEMLNIVEQCGPELGYDLASLGPRSPTFWHVLLEAKKIAYTDLFEFNGDPRFVDVPVDRLTSDAYAREQCSRIDLDQASGLSPAGSDGGGTVYLSVADRQGNMVSFIYSIFEYFGSQITVPGYGFPMNNRGNQFSLDPESPNIVAPRKRPFQTIIPAFVMKDGRPVMAFGNMGGDEQPQAQATELVDMIDLGMNVQAAGDAARFHHSQTRNRVDLESRLYDLVGADLQAMGHTVRRVTGDLMGGYQAIHFTPLEGGAFPQQTRGGGPVNGIYRAGTDFRKDGQAAGW
jgi:gamma-glutamyltranspeptidase / glutathione hydrolase